MHSYDESTIQLDPESAGNAKSNTTATTAANTAANASTTTATRDIESGKRRTVNDSGLARSLDAGSDDEDSAEENDDDDDEDDDDRHHADDDDAMSEASYDEKFKELEEEVATLVADVHDLALYTKLNFTGFVKIVKVSGSWRACVCRLL